jgi:hypothetical protein
MPGLIYGYIIPHQHRNMQWYGAITTNESRRLRRRAVRQKDTVTITAGPRSRNGCTGQITRQTD